MTPDITALVDGVGDDDAVVVAVQLQPESGFGFFDLLLRLLLGIPFHTSEEQNFSGVEDARCDETVTKGWQAKTKPP